MLSVTWHIVPQVALSMGLLMMTASMTVDRLAMKPGFNDSHIPHDDEFEIDEEEGTYRFSDYQQWPHAGVLSTQSWLARYPSTDTNRNRARPLDIFSFFRSGYREVRAVPPTQRPSQTSIIPL